MKARLFAAAGLVLAAAQPLAAQGNSCPASTGNPNTVSGAQQNATADLCGQGRDVFQLMAPQLGTLLTGGNATLGQGGSMGGLGHFSLGLRVNVIDGDYPEISSFPTPRTSANQAGRALPTKNQPLPMPTVDAAIGIFKGIPLGLTNVGGVDLLVSATYVPKLEQDEVSLEPNSSLKFGFGGRLGLLQESLVVPGIAVTYLKRDLPTMTIRTTDPDFDIAINDASVKTTAWRVVANKNLMFLGLAAGYGQDKYDQETFVSGTVRNITIAGVPTPFTADLARTRFAQELTRNNMFLDVSLNLPLVKLVGEIGQVSGGDDVLGAGSNSFVDSDGKANSPTKSRKYGSVGLRIAF